MEYLNIRKIKDKSISSLLLKKIMDIFNDPIISRRIAAVLGISAFISCIATYISLTTKYYDTNTVYWLLNLDLILLLMLGIIVAKKVASLWVENKQGIAGSKIHARLVFMFSLLAATPAVIMAVFSVLFFYFGIQSWFNDRVSTAVNESMTVAKAYLEEHQHVMRVDILAMGNDLNRDSGLLLGNQKGFSKFVQTQAQLRNLSEAIVFNKSREILAKSDLSFSLIFNPISDEDLYKAESEDVVLLLSEDYDKIRALIKLDNFSDAYLLAGRFVDAKVVSHLESVKAAVKEYTELEDKRSQLQISVTILFLVVAFILLFISIWLGLMLSQKMIEPIGDLIRASARISSGDLSVRIDETTNDDEISQLAIAFNHMTKQIELQRDQVMEANFKLDERRRFTEAVLSGASSGVIGLDNRGVITLVNNTALDLLQLNQPELINRDLLELIPEIEGAFREAFKNPEKPGESQIEYIVKEGNQEIIKILLVRVTVEQGKGEDVGAVVTFDDITLLVAAQRQSAWSDVARRIAHEIKNPLTPIQLSAERLKRKYLKQIKEDPETFSKCIDTIIRQVDVIGRMVNEFSDFARMPTSIKNKTDVIDICKSAYLLQKQAHPEISFEFFSFEENIFAKCDKEQITQVITNLLQNAIDSITESSIENGEIFVKLSNKSDNIIIEIIDNGIGLPSENRDKLTEPYITTRKKGTGLGLAIVKKILKDHSGDIKLEDIDKSNPDNKDFKSGAHIIVSFPKDN